MSTFIPAKKHYVNLSSNAFCCISYDKQILVTKKHGLPKISDLPCSLIKQTEWIQIGILDDFACLIPLNEIIPSEGENTSLELANLRAWMHQAEHGQLFAVTYARSFGYWLKKHAFCGQCGTKLEWSEKDTARICPSCHALFYPTTSNAIIVLIQRSPDEILLAHNKNFPRGKYSLIAGFLEPGETLEHAVHREIMEEIGITVKNIRYYRSQFWPYPNSLMTGFLAEYQSGNIHPDGEEIEDANFFKREHLPDIPEHGSIARCMLDDWLNHKF